LLLDQAKHHPEEILHALTDLTAELFVDLAILGFATLVDAADRSVGLE
jgi:hypothetical protein